MSGVIRPTVSTALAHARRELEYLEKRYASGNFKGEASRWKWKIDCQRFIVSNLHGQLPPAAPQGSARAVVEAD